MDANFERALKLVLKHEGGFVNNPRDPGGATNKGITIGTFRRYVNAKATVDDLKRISDAEVSDIYRRQFWNAVQGSVLPSGLDYALFDFAVNSGPDRAIKYVQAAVGVKQDGKLGNETLSAISQHPTARLINSLCDARLAFMRRAKDKQGRLLWDTFGKGWNTRVAGVRKESLALVVKPSDAPVQPSPPPVPVQEVRKGVGKADTLESRPTASPVAKRGFWEIFLDYLLNRKGA